MRRDAEHTEPGDLSSRRNRQDLTMVFGPWLAAIAYVAVMLLAVVLTPSEYRNWAIGIGVLLFWVAGIAYLVWAFKFNRRRG